MPRFGIVKFMVFKLKLINQISVSFRPMLPYILSRGNVLPSILSIMTKFIFCYSYLEAWGLRGQPKSGT